MSLSTLALEPGSELKFIALQNEAKQLAAEGKLKESLEKFEMAKGICPTAKVLRRIQKLKDCLKQYCAEEPNPENVSLVSGDALPSVEQENTKNRSSISRNSSIMPKALSNIENLEQSRFSRTDELSPQSQAKFRELRNTAKELSYEGHYEEAVKCFRKALKIFDCPKVKRYIKELELVMKNSDQIMEQNENLSDIVKPETHPCLSDTLNIMKPKSPLPSSMAPSDSVSLREFQCSSSLNHVKTENKLIPHKSSSMSETSDTEEKLAKVKELYYEARELAADGKLMESLRLLKKAFAIHETERVLKQIRKIEELLCEEAKGDEMVNITSDFKIFHEIYDKLYPYQREGVAWMWNLFKKTKGGVLGDDMGLGKTFQVIAFLSGMIDADLIKHVLIIMPVSLICNWRKEFKKWCPGISVSDFHGGTKKERERNLLKVQRRGHVLLTSYGMLVSNLTSLINMDSKEFIWDYVILDEGHKIKNPTKTTKAVHDIPARYRLLLTGTPIQNNLRELWSLYDFVHQGTLLGSLKTFKMQYENPITRSREKDATAGEKRLGTEMAENLKTVIKPYFLRRTKEEIWGNNDRKSEVEELGSQIENMSISKLTAKKNDLILWTLMSEPQIGIYESFLHSNAVKAILVSKRSPLVELTTLKKICDHPRLLSKRACMQLGLNGETEKDLLEEQDLDDEESQASTIDNVSDETLLKESGKLNLVIKLLENLREAGHRTLVFSLSRKILDMIHRILVNRNWKVMRVDGTISKMEERERRIQKFQRDPSYPVFLLTTQVGGVGITLTAADRVIIYDPSWNPATDSQAVDRVYRIGQEKDVVVYRIITCGTVEEKIYRRQVFKDSITRQTTGNTSADPYRYFSKQELRELFSLEDPYTSATQIQLSEMHSSERSTSEELETHIAFLQQLNIFGISDHDLMFSRNIEDPTEDNECLPVSYDYIKRQVATAHELIQKEASVVAEGMRLAGVYSRPYQESLPLPKKAPTKDGYKPPVLPPVVDLTEDAQHFPSYKKERSPTAFQPSGFIDLTSEEHLDKDNEDDAGTVSTPGKNEQMRFEIERFFSTGGTQNSPVIPSYENISEIESISNSDLSTEELVKRLSCKLELPIRSEELSLTEGNDTPEVCIEDDSLPCEIESKVPPLPVTISDSESVQQEPTESVRHNENYSSLDSVPKKQDSLLNSSKFVSNVQENFQHNLTRLMTAEDLDDLSFDEVSNRTQKSSRKSCARKSAIFISDSENSQQESCPPSLNTTANLVDESENHDSDSSNSTYLSFTADSMPNIPVIEGDSKPLLLAETPVKSVNESLSGSISVMHDSDSIWRKRDGSARRITPLKVDRSFTHQNPSFSKALAASPILPRSPVKSNDDFKESFSKPVINTSFDHSPIKKWRNKARVPALDSDSEDENVPQKDCAVTAETEEIDHGSSNVLNSDLEDKNVSLAKITGNLSFSRAKASISSIRKWRKSSEASVLVSNSEEKNIPPVKITDHSRLSFSNAEFNANFDSPIRKWRKKAVVTALDSDSESENVPQMECEVAAETKKIDSKSGDFVDKKNHLESEDENVSKMDSTLDITDEKLDNKSMESLSKHSRTASLAQESDMEDDILTDDSSDSEYSNSEESMNSDESGSIFSQD